jgi:hypothetical protein
MTLDEAEQKAHDMLDALRREYELRATPYIKILSDIHACRIPAITMTVEGGVCVSVARNIAPDCSHPRMRCATCGDSFSRQDGVQ